MFSPTAIADFLACEHISALNRAEAAGQIKRPFFADPTLELLIKLGKEDNVLGFIASTGDRDILTVETSRGAEQTISTAKYEITGRGGKGRELLQRGQFTRVLWPTPDAPAPLSST